MVRGALRGSLGIVLALPEEGYDGEDPHQVSPSGVSLLLSSWLWPKASGPRPGPISHCRHLLQQKFRSRKQIWAPILTLS